MSFDRRAFRNALGCFPTGVAVVTGLTEAGAPIGLTVNSFTGLSLDPPLVLFCLDDKSAYLGAFDVGRSFAVNVLGEEQRDLSVRFAGRIEDRWVDLSYHRWSTGVPILPDCLANFECTTVDNRNGGDHRILIGRVGRIEYVLAGQPLLFYRSEYRSVGG